MEEPWNWSIQISSKHLFRLTLEYILEPKSNKKEKSEYIIKYSRLLWTSEITLLHKDFIIPGVPKKENGGFSVPCEVKCHMFYIIS